MSQKSESNWMQTLWRPMMGWMYMLICLLDMAVFPVLWALWQGINHAPITQWNPLTLQGAGLFHIAMGAVLGISAFGRTQEKLAGTAANPTATSQTMTNNTNMSGVPAGMSGGMNSGMGGGFGGGSFGGSMSSGGFGGTSSGGFGSSTGGASAFGAPASGGFGSSSGFGSSTPTSSGGGFGSTPSTSGFGSTGTTATATPVTSSTGKLGPAPISQPVL
jgi:hypothetical protein